MTDDRIKAAQQDIQQLLKARPEYVIDTSEFQDSKLGSRCCRTVTSSTTRTVRDPR